MLAIFSFPFPPLFHIYFCPSVWNLDQPTCIGPGPSEHFHTNIFTSAELCFGCGLYLERYRIFCISSICLLFCFLSSCLCTLVFLTFDRCTVRCQGWSIWSDSTALVGWFSWFILLFPIYLYLVFSYRCNADMSLRMISWLFLYSFSIRRWGY